MKLQLIDYNIESNCKIIDKDKDYEYKIKKIYFYNLEKTVTFEIGSFISEGKYGSTYEAYNTNDPKQCKYILKKIQIFNDSLDSYSLNDFKNEITSQNNVAKYNLTDPIILAYILADEPECGYIMKRYNITLYDFLNDNSNSLKNKKKYLRKSRRLLEKLVLKAKICHCDLHLKNIMFDNDGNLKVIDFGNSKKIDEIDKRLDSEVFSNSLKDLEDLNEDELDELLAYWENEVMYDFDDFIVDY